MLGTVLLHITILAIVGLSIGWLIPLRVAASSRVRRDVFGPTDSKAANVRQANSESPGGRAPVGCPACTGDTRLDKRTSCERRDRTWVSMSGRPAQLLRPTVPCRLRVFPTEMTS